MSYLLTSLLAGGVSGTIVAFLLKTWIEARLKASIEHEYDRKLEALRFEMRAREQAAKVAELMTEARDGSTELTPDPAKNINKLAWELSLWLPADTVRELISHLCYAEGSKTMKEVLVDVRKHILANPKDDLKAEQIVHFEVKKEV
jgi:hypothetical protein